MCVLAVNAKDKIVGSVGPRKAHRVAWHGQFQKVAPIAMVPTKPRYVLASTIVASPSWFLFTTCEIQIIWVPGTFAARPAISLDRGAGMFAPRADYAEAVIASIEADHRSGSSFY